MRTALGKGFQATDAFRKVYGAFETLMDTRQQRRLLWILGKLDKTLDEQMTFEEEEADGLSSLSRGPKP